MEIVDLNAIIRFVAPFICFYLVVFGFGAGVKFFFKINRHGAFRRDRHATYTFRSAQKKDDVEGLIARKSINVRPSVIKAPSVIEKQRRPSVIDDSSYEISSAEKKGCYGEELVEDELEQVGTFAKTIRNVYVPKRNGETSEIDLVYITTRGIFVIESKYYDGWIFGDEEGYKWTACYRGGKKFQFYNPIRQNRTHMKWLRNLIDNRNIPLYSIIVFSNDCEFKKLTVTTPGIHVVNRRDLRPVVREKLRTSKTSISEQYVEMLAEKIREYANPNREVKEKHIMAIQEKYR